MSMFEVDTDPKAFDSRFRGDAGVYARFYIHPELDHKASEQEDRPIFVDREYIEIRASGNAKNIVQRRASPEDRQRFREQYMRFREGMSEQASGTPLSEVTWLTRSQVEELSYLQIRTVEALANLNDAECGKKVGLFELKRRAGEYLEKANGEAARLAKLEEDNAELKRQLAELMAQKAPPAKQIIK